MNAFIRSKSMGGWKNTFPLFVMVFITTSSVYFIAPILGPFLLNQKEFISQQHRHIYYCLALTLPQVFMIVGPPLWGALSDQFDRKRLLVLALIGVTMSVLISAIGIKFQWLWCLLLGQALLGITDASDCLAQAAVIDLSDCSNKLRNMNLVNFSSTLGLVVGPLFGGILSDQKICSAFHYETPFIIALFLLILNILCILFVYPASLRNVDRTIIHKRIFDFSFIFSTPGLKFLIIIFFMLELTLGIYYQTMFLFLTEHMNYSPSKVGSFYAFFAIMICSTYLFLTPLLTRRLNKYQLIAASFSAISGSGVVLTFFHSEFMIWIFSIPLAICVALIYSFSMTLFSDFSRRDDQGKIMGATMSIVAISFFFAGIIINLGFNLNRVFLIFSIIAMIGFVYTMVVPKKFTSVFYEQ